MTSWQERAACLDVPLDVMFPIEARGPTVDRARRICASCPVIGDCLDHAITVNEQWGVWGGLTETERRSLRRRRRRLPDPDRVVLLCDDCRRPFANIVGLIDHLVHDHPSTSRPRRTRRAAERRRQAIRTGDPT